MKLTIKDIARIAEVSVSAASLALNDKAGVSEDTREKVKAIAEKFNYTPNHSAQSLITRRSRCIGLVVTDINNPFFAMLVDEFNKLLDKFSYTLLLGISGDKIAAEKKYIETFISKNVEGVIIVPTIETNPDMTHLFKLKNLGIPFVFCTSAYTEFLEPCVMSDLREGEYQIVNHLLSKGMKKIYFITGDRNLLLSKLRLDGYMQAFKDANLSYHPDWIIETVPDFNHGYQVTLNCMSDRPDAIVCVNDYLAMGVIKALKDQRICVPQDISVVGYDDLLFASILETPLTTVRQPIGDICMKTFEVLRRRIAGNYHDESVCFLSPMVKIRESTK